MAAKNANAATQDPQALAALQSLSPAGLYQAQVPDATIPAIDQTWGPWLDKLSQNAPQGVQTAARATKSDPLSGLPTDTGGLGQNASWWGFDPTVQTSSAQMAAMAKGTPLDALRNWKPGQTAGTPTSTTPQVTMPSLGQVG